MLGRRVYPLEVAAAQVCREGGARVSTNVYVRDMDLAAFNSLDSRRLEVVADGLTLFGGPSSPQTQLSSRSCTETGPPGGGLHTSMARHWKSHGAGRSAHTRNWQVTKGGPAWWCWPLKWVDGGTPRPAQFISALAKARSSSVPEILQARVEAAWLGRWSAILACRAARAFTLSLLDQRPVPRISEVSSSHEVLRDDRFVQDGQVSSWSFFASDVVHDIDFSFLILSQKKKTVA